MSDLPKEIADMCGVVIDPVTAKTRSQPHETLLKMEMGRDGVYEVTYNSHKVGWIQPMEDRQDKKYRALSIHGRISHHWTLDSAQNFLMENFH